jgi:uncharacterized protein DUF4375
MENDSEQTHKVYKPYKELTLEILATLPDDELEHAIIDYIFEKFTNARNAEMRLEIILNMSSGFQMVWFTWELLVSVLHGGFNEFFYNRSDEVTRETLRYLEMIGATEYYELLKQVIEAHQEEMRNPVMQELYSQQTLHGYSESHRLSSLKEYDDGFVKLGFRLDELKVHFIRSNPELFVGS